MKLIGANASRDDAEVLGRCGSETDKESILLENRDMARFHFSRDRSNTADMDRVCEAMACRNACAARRLRQIVNR
jgi:hypothetical protein